LILLTRFSIFLRRISVFRFVVAVVFAAFLLNYYLLLLQSATAAWQIDAIFQFGTATRRMIVCGNKYINGAAAAPTLELQSAFPTLC